MSIPFFMIIKGRVGYEWPVPPLVHFLWAVHNGIFACFLQGRWTFLLAKTSRSQHIRARVEDGWMMSSTNPRESKKRRSLCGWSSTQPLSAPQADSVGSAWPGREMQAYKPSLDLWGISALPGFLTFGIGTRQDKGMWPLPSCLEPGPPPCQDGLNGT